MTEHDWLTSTDPAAMLGWLTTPRDVGYGGVSDRRLRLFAAACCRQVWHLLTDERSRRAVEVAERYADGLATDQELTAARAAARAAAWDAAGDAAWAARAAARAVRAARAAARTKQAHLLRHIIGNPWRPALSVPCGVCVGKGGHVLVGGETGRHEPANAMSQEEYRDGHKEVWRKLYPSRWAKCPKCSARGWTPIEPPGEMCRRCKGKGTERYCDAAGDMDDRDCGDCHGTGRIIHWPREVLDLAAALYAGNQDAAPLLHDALLEHGGEAGALLAEHFRPRRKCWNCQGYGNHLGAGPDRGNPECSMCHGIGWLGKESHPRGCAWLDYVLGKE